ncbi:6837_t:CDS:2 [Funneliformis geosporum]|uniref:3093_t:CDS:1 n=1 Tax=Funneliformis geosporum TaxID=1117311 RepID=A0A9W4SGD1_9GLOM|nr:6837_t:CDS:2 [Funneliformis geosporum]CAI2168582.1 3093_t:CDS:2 [Funneliformis geosporum]
MSHTFDRKKPPQLKVLKVPTIDSEIPIPRLLEQGGESLTEGVDEVDEVGGND